MTDSGRYRALPVQMDATCAETIETLFGPVSIPGAMVAEAREYHGGELALVFEPSGTAWTLGNDVIAGLELWLYGTKRVTFEAQGDFLAKPQRLSKMDLADNAEIVFEGGRVAFGATHAVLRVQVI